MNIKEIPPAGSDLWLQRCADRFAERAGLTPAVAKEVAQLCFENFDVSDDSTPEEAADEEMSNWDNDE